MKLKLIAWATDIFLCAQSAQFPKFHMHTHTHTHTHNYIPNTVDVYNMKWLNGSQVQCEQCSIKCAKEEKKNGWPIRYASFIYELGGYSFWPFGRNFEMG